MKILAVTNIKGGVGKTTTAVNLSFLCARSKRRTLLWDLDPQGAATFTLRCESHPLASAKRLVTGKTELPELLLPSGYDNLDVLPSHFSYRNFDLHLAQKKHPTERLLKMSRALRAQYDVLMLDCPPGISLLSENVLRAADGLIVPLIPSPLSVRMLAELQQFIDANDWGDLSLMPFFSMVDRRRSLHREVILSTREQVPALLPTEIPNWSEIERMTQRRAPLPSYAPCGEAALVYEALWQDIETRMAIPAATTAADGPPATVEYVSAQGDTR